MEIDATTLYVLRRHEALPAIYGEAPTANAAARGYFDRMITGRGARDRGRGGRTSSGRSSPARTS